LLAGREHSRRELARKLNARGFGEGRVGDLLDDLEQRGLLSDERFAGEYVAMRARKGFGPVRIRAELVDRGVASGLIEDALDRPEYDWRGLLQEVCRSKYGESAPCDRREMARRARFLVHRGFPETLVRELLLDADR